METNEIIMLRQEMQALRDKVSLLEAGLAQAIARADFDRDAMFQFIKERLRELDVYIFPTFNKVFPEFAKNANEIDKIIGWKPNDCLPTNVPILPDGKKII